jgi:hypothetical protein
MKKIPILVTFLLLAYCQSFGQLINVSTGLGPDDANEPNWKVGTAVPATSTPYIKYASANWEPQPVSVTNAKWIVPSINLGAGQTTYYYERLFTVATGVKLMQLKLNVTADDILNAIELVRPNQTAINIPFAQSTTGYRFTREINDSISCPVNGEWKLRVKVFCADRVGNEKLTGLLVSGSLNLIKGSCDTSKPIEINPCCPPWNKELMKSMMLYSGSGSIGDPYTLLFQPSATFNSQMQAYINYLKTINPAYNGITIVFGAHNQGSTLPAPGTYATSPVGGLTWVTWVPGGNGTPTFSPATGSNQILGNGFPLQVGNWYSINSGIFLQNGPRFFPKNCDDNLIYIRIQAVANKSATGANPDVQLEISDGKKVMQTVPLKQEKKSGIGRG